MVPVLYNSAMNRIELLAITFLDLVNETYTHYERKNILKLIGSPIISEEDHWVIRRDPSETTRRGGANRSQEARVAFLAFARGSIAMACGGLVNVAGAPTRGPGRWILVSPTSET